MNYYLIETLKKSMAAGGSRKDANLGHPGMQINTFRRSRSLEGSQPSSIYLFISLTEGLVFFAIALYSTPTTQFTSIQCGWYSEVTQTWIGSR